MSSLRTALLMAAMTALFMGIGAIIGGEAGMMLAFLFALATNMFAYWNADKIVLRMYKAREVDTRTAPELFGIVQYLAVRASLPMPKVYIIDNPQPNAFATGRNPENAAVAATSGLLKLLNRSEIEAVMAHELAHVKNRDTLTMTITATIAGAISMLAHFGLFFGGNRNNPLGLVGTILVVLLAPLAAMLVQMAISRTREFAADKTGAEICGKPMALASALNKLQQGAGAIDNREAEENPATAHLFIVNPLHGMRLDSLFSTHPKVEDRIARLSEMNGGSGRSSAGRPSASRSGSNRPGRQARGSSGVPDTRDRGTGRGPWG